MRISSLFVASLAVAILSIAPLLFGLSSTAMAQNATPSGGATTSLPNVVVEAPKQVARPQKPKQRAVARSTVSPRTSSTTPASSASPMSPTAQLEKLPNAITGSCVDGCVSSLPSGNKPWVGCNLSAGVYSSTCRNVGHYKTYNECTTAGLAIGWRSNETLWYCTSLALK
ncbi:hypothetical protein SAMN05444169_8619 [Bradyrhizobium erythrophlei]|jgi:hypothetical protein|uniref:Kazal-type serine protease inhibitor domain-containing protein n=1 Tax=Bradyrhizobium erythrophlei TaxID=1437360 RepID=A0A1M5US62_9BRAD|nr:hypothetical protein SAMN05444169_8619 [Bradyrhizobium erythrophlei]